LAGFEVGTRQSPKHLRPSSRYSPTHDRDKGRKR
jgi:hypothetical protein